MNISFLLLLLASIFLVFTSIKRKWLSQGGAIVMGLMGMSIGTFMSYFALVPLLLFFGSSVLIGRLFPHEAGSSDAKDRQARDIIQVLANGGIYWAICLWYIITEFLFYRDFTGAISIQQLGFFNSAAQGNEVLIWVLLLASAASSTADTWASEIGQYFRGPTYDIFRWKKVPIGLSGGISWAGSLGALIGSSLIGSLVFCLPFGNGPAFLFISCAGFIGMLIDSVLGASLQRQYFTGTSWSDQATNHPTHTRGWAWMTNDAVNFLANGLLIGLLLCLNQLL